MPTYNLEVDFNRNGKMNEVFHPTLPFSYLREQIYIGSSGTENAWTTTLTVTANRPFFLLAYGSPEGNGHSYGIGSITVTNLNNGTWSVRININRIITHIDPRTGTITWNADGKQLFSHLNLVVGDIRG